MAMLNPEYKIVCINLKRRPDRRAKMEKQFIEQEISNYYFFEAFDGHNIDLTNPQLSLYKHDWTNFVCRRGPLGCSLSHYNVWTNLTLDANHDIYVVLEDDVELVPNFKFHLENFITQVRSCMFFVYLGMTVTRDNYAPTRSVYRDDKTYKIYPMIKENYLGGNFGYIITKPGALNLIHGIKDRGIKNTIDDIVNMYCPNLYESHPHIVFTDAYEHVDHDVDTDIHNDYDENNHFRVVDVRKNPVINNYVFDDYDFYPWVDSFGGDIKQYYCDIEALKRIADSRDDCVAFNTYGWLKNNIKLPQYFQPLKPNFFNLEGIYVKKNFRIRF